MKVAWALAALVFVAGVSRLGDRLTDLTAQDWVVFEDVNATLGAQREEPLAAAARHLLPLVATALDYYYITALLLLLPPFLHWHFSVLRMHGGWHGEGRRIPKRRISKDMMPPYPNGWFKVLSSEDLKKGEVKSVQLCGQKLVAFRNQQGKVGVLDAYCPHLGADLGVHGRVVDNCVECPFHAWRFNPDGECEGIQYSDTIPKGANIDSYPVREQNLAIYVWHDAEKREPMWEPPHFPEIENGDFYCAAWSGHEILTHIQEIPENGADVAHLNVLHKPFIYSGDLHKGKVGPVAHVWEATWQVDKENPHQTNMTVQMDMSFFGINPFLPSVMRFPVIANQVGPGLTNLRLKTPLGEILMKQTITPVQQLRLRAEHIYYASRGVPRLFAKAVGWGASRQFERDIAIWEAKTYLQKPLLARGDGPVGAYRSWFRKFYSENSKPFGAEDETTEW